ncbi:glycosyltransferase family 4 protein [Desulfovibrio sp.]|uniref:glycosyltransferase family 4 protein n=1 Tax=Desulfovibrio sp. TaxID=885 RepID=UPI0023C8F001|nr:glycosyltransferase family 4 protein [Desulfovibrio sp.]MDE7240838.1 glycosyltransferase family 4 protein [Desulfovibrio sp.]
MRVLMFGWEFPPYISGGLGTACYGMTHALAQLGVEVIFVLPHVEDAATDFLKLESASGTLITQDMQERMAWAGQEIWRSNIRYLQVDSPLMPYLTPESYREALKSMSSEATPGGEVVKTHAGPAFTWKLKGGYGPELMTEVYRYGRLGGAIALQEDFDVIHAHDWMTYPAGILAKALTGKPLVVHIHATEYDRSGENINEIVGGIERAGLLAADVVVAVSQLTRNMVIQRYGVPPEKVKVVYNAVERHDVARHYEIPPRIRHEKRVLFLGRITFQKGPEYFMEAARLVLEKIPNVRFFMAGSGDMLPRLVRRAGQLRIGSRFHFAGFLRGEQVDRMFALSDLYVMPSVSEPFGITPLEAMLYDVPVLLSRQSGVSEVLEHALKADFWDTRDMADKICAVLRYPSLAEDLVKNCREEMKSIRWGNAAEQLLQIYRNVTGEN